MTWSLDFTTLYAANANQFGTLNTTTGLFSAKASTIASAADPMQGEFGAITVADVDGISFDPATGRSVWRDPPRGHEYASSTC